MDHSNAVVTPSDHLVTMATEDANGPRVGRYGEMKYPVVANQIQGAVHVTSNHPMQIYTQDPKTLSTSFFIVRGT